MTNAISVRHLSKSFGKTQVLQRIDLEIPAGAATCVIGPSGSGKSTLLRCLAFLEEADSGTIEVFGEPLGFTEDAQGGARACPPPSCARCAPGSAWCSSSSTCGRT